MDKFHDFIGVQGVLALGMSIAVVAMIFMRYEVPKELWALLGIAWGFYFAKNGKVVNEKYIKNNK